MAASHATPYVGRFAPSPTGRLHLGSLIAAIGSYLDARAHDGRWLLRIDDLDTPRNEPGAAEAIIVELERLGLDWDGSVHRQSETLERYHVALERLRDDGLAFACSCSRQALVDGVYPGHCRNGLAPGATPRALRLRVNDAEIVLEDRMQGRFAQNLATACGDFVVHRADGVVAYHLATVVDDAYAGVTDVLRGADLLASTPRQIALQHALALATPRYAHLPMLLGDDHAKLSKQNRAPSTAREPALALWRACLQALGQHPALAEDTITLEELRAAAIEHWRRDRVPVGPLAAPSLA